ncbi:MAG: response regulator transcription factor [Chloroflexi bacterium]|nr:response regulator transcription factor [Chloroflexota bacterium]
MNAAITVAILDDHQIAVDGSLFRLSHSPNIRVVKTAAFWSEMDAFLQEEDVDVLILDVGVPSSAEDPTYYPIRNVVTDLLAAKPEMAILVISMYAQRPLIQAVMQAGASGYLLKDDVDAILNLASIVETIAGKDVYYSPKTLEVLRKKQGDDVKLTNSEQEVLFSLASHPNLTTSQLAKLRNIAPSTFRNHLSAAYVKLNVNNRVAAIERARQLGLLPKDMPPPKVDEGEDE